MVDTSIMGMKCLLLSFTFVCVCIETNMKVRSLIFVPLVMTANPGNQIKIFKQASLKHAVSNVKKMPS